MLTKPLTSSALALPDRREKASEARRGAGALLLHQVMYMGLLSSSLFPAAEEGTAAACSSLQSETREAGEASKERSASCQSSLFFSLIDGSTNLIR